MTLVRHRRQISPHREVGVCLAPRGGGDSHPPYPAGSACGLARLRKNGPRPQTAGWALKAGTATLVHDPPTISHPPGFIPMTPPGVLAISRRTRRCGAPGSPRHQRKPIPTLVKKQRQKASTQTSMRAVSVGQIVQSY